MKCLAAVRRLRLIIRRLIIRLSIRSPWGGPHGLHTCRLRPHRAAQRRPLVDVQPVGAEAQGERSIGVILHPHT